MGEKQEKVWVVVRSPRAHPSHDKPVKVFDDRKDARSYCASYNKRTKKYYVHYVGARRG